MENIQEQHQEDPTSRPTAADSSRGATDTDQKFHTNEDRKQQQSNNDQNSPNNANANTNDNANNQQQQQQQNFIGGGGANNDNNNNIQQQKEQLQQQQQPNASLGNSSSLDASREARIYNRRARILAERIAKTKTENLEETENLTKKADEPERNDAGKSKIQISLSKKRADTVKLNSTDQVTSVKVTVVAREAQKRIEEFRKVELWDQKRKEERLKSITLEDDIEKEWQSCLQIHLPFDLHGLLVSQKSHCDDLIAIKNKLINEYISELKTKDDEYVKELKRQAEEIDNLLGKMETQYRTFQTTLVEEMTQIERAFVEERTELLQSNINDIEKIFISRRENERKFMEERGERMEDHIYQLEQLRVHDAEEYNLVKIKLETDVKVLEQQLQQMRGTYQLNQEKLEYNFQVLKKREEENGTILGAQKRKIARLTDHLNILKTKIAKQEKSFHQEYLTLTDDYKRITEQFKELQKKFRHFQLADNKKFHEIWSMNEELAKEKIRKVLQADRIIHEQQLGLEWNPSKEEIFKLTEESGLLQHQADEENNNNINQNDKQHQQRSLNSSEKDKDGSGNAVGGSGAAAAMFLAANALESGGGDHKNGDDDADLGTFKESFGVKLSRRGYSRTMKKMLELLCNEAGFLVEERLQKLLSPLQKDEQSLMKLDSILKALGVETIEDIEVLTSYFIAKPTSSPQPSPPTPYTQFQEANEDQKPKTGFSISSSGEESLKLELAVYDASQQQQRDLVSPLVSIDQTAGGVQHDLSSYFIDPNEVVKAIRRFVEQNNEKARSNKYYPDGQRDEMSFEEIEDQQLTTANKKEIESELETSSSTQQKQLNSVQQKIEGGGDELKGLLSTKTPLGQRNYWERLGNAIDDKNYRTWSAVYVGMEKYHELLSERWQLSQEIGTVSRQNQELRQLLRQYMTSKENDELQIPPTSIMMGQAFGETK